MRGEQNHLLMAIDAAQEEQQRFSAIEQIDIVDNEVRFSCTLYLGQIERRECFRI